ncbi:MAG: hypothetical protein HY791_36345 [Deltaproteobacteria bacterium]|nr:hypothetical protein [Deltaproteobacteria bacterium]
MYAIHERDRVVELHDLLQSGVGAPCPMMLATEGDLLVVYFVEETPIGGDGPTVRVVGPDSAEPAAIVRFTRPYASMFGPPNDKAFGGLANG